MNKNYSLRSMMEFKKVYSLGNNYWNRNLILYVRKNEINFTRIGYSITKKIGNAVVRNKIRRRMKEIIRLNYNDLLEGYDLVLIPKRNVVDITYEELENAILHILQISKLLKIEWYNVKTCCIIN